MIIVVISTVLCVVHVDILQHIGCSDSAVVSDNVDVTLTVISVADDGHVTVSVHRYPSLLARIHPALLVALDIAKIISVQN